MLPGMMQVGFYGGVSTAPLSNITFLGSKTATLATAAGANVSLTDLLDTAGSPATLLEGDTVVVAIADSNSSDRDGGDMRPPNFTDAHASLFASNGGDQVNLAVSYRKMGETPDTVFFNPGVQIGATAGRALTVYAFRNVDFASPLDVASTTSSNANNGLPNAPSITPVSEGSIIMATGAISDGAGTNAMTNPSGMSGTTNHFRDVVNGSPTSPGIATALYTSWTSGAYDPAVFGGGNSGAGTDAAVTMALRAQFTSAETSVSGSYVTITVPSGAVSSNLSDFPVYIDLSDLGAGFWAGVAADGSDIRVTNSDATVILPVDVVTIDTGTDTGRLFFRTDLLTASDNVFRIYYATGKTALAAGHPQGRNKVWDGWHSVVDGAENINRVGETETWTLAGNAAFSGGVVTLDGTGDHILKPCGLPTKLGMFVIGYLATGGGTHKGVMSWTQDTDTGPQRISMAVRSTGKWATWNSTNSWLDGATTATYDADFTLCLNHDSVAPLRQLFVNGASDASQASAVAPVADNDPHLWIGCGSPTETMNGTISLALCKFDTIPSAMIAGLHLNRRTRASFYTVS